MHGVGNGLWHWISLKPLAHQDVNLWLKGFKKIAQLQTFHAMFMAVLVCS